MFTADEYRTAAKVVRSLDIVRASDLDSLAEQVQVREEHAYELGMVGVADYPALRGAKLMGYLVETGWTPPEGLF